MEKQKNKGAGIKTLKKNKKNQHQLKNYTVERRLSRISEKGLRHFMVIKNAILG